jgi:hypothetical protein
MANSYCVIGRLTIVGRIIAIYLPIKTIKAKNGGKYT